MIFHTRSPALPGMGLNVFAMPDNNLSIQQKKDYAKVLFLKHNLTQKEIAEEVGVSEVSMSHWVNEGRWENMRKSLTTTKAEQLAFLYDIMAKLTEEGKKALEDDDPDTNPDTDAISKISKSIERLEKDAGVGEMIQTGIAFISFVEKEDIEPAKIISHWFYLFIQDKMQSAK